MPTHSVGPGGMTREGLTAPCVLLADTFRVASEHLEVREVISNMRLIEAVVAVSLLALE